MSNIEDYIKGTLYNYDGYIDDFYKKIKPLDNFKDKSKTISEILEVNPETLPKIAEAMLYSEEIGDKKYIQKIDDLLDEIKKINSKKSKEFIENYEKQYNHYKINLEKVEIDGKKF